MKHLLVPCAVFLGMGMAPPKSNNIDPLERPDVKTIRENAGACETNYGTGPRRVSCLGGETLKLERALERYVSEIKPKLPPELKAKLETTRAAWAREEDPAESIMRERGRPSAKVGALNQRFFQLRRHFRWVAQLNPVAVPEPTTTAGVEPVAAEPALAPVAPVVQATPAPAEPPPAPATLGQTAPLAPAPVEATKPAPVEIPKPSPVETTKPALVEAPKPAPVEAPKAAPVEAPKAAPVETPKPALVEAPKPAPVVTPAHPSVRVVETPAPTPPAVPVVPGPAPRAPYVSQNPVVYSGLPPRMIMIQLRLVHQWCIQHPNMRQGADSGRSVCDLMLKQDVEFKLDAYFKDQLANVPAARRDFLRTRQQEWKASRQKKCDYTMNYPSPQVEREATKCWYKETLARTDWVAGMTGAR